ncbi:sporulation protein [Pseudoflavonifractor sp.]|uniref:sporulation protein n=1 Tax=Pseudoflavonifractor sp. TaxID=1980281 RepID=UPI003D8CC9C5
MEILSSIGAILVFTMACNLDTILLSMGYAVRGLTVSPGGCLILAGVTTVVTWLSLALGASAGQFLPAGLADMLGGLVLLGIGLWFLLDWLRSPVEGTEPLPPVRAWVPLAAALAVNNAGAGVAAGISGLSPLGAAVCNFGVTLLFIPLGGWLGAGPSGRLLGKYALPLSGLLLVLLGCAEAFL